MKTLWRHICAFILILLLCIKAFMPELANDMRTQLKNILDADGERRAALEEMGARIVQSGVTEEIKAALAYLETLIENSHSGGTKKAISQDAVATAIPEASLIPYNGS